MPFLGTFSDFLTLFSDFEANFLMDSVDGIKSVRTFFVQLFKLYNIAVDVIAEAPVIIFDQGV